MGAIIDNFIENYVIKLYIIENCEKITVFAKKGLTVWLVKVIWYLQKRQKS